MPWLAILVGPALLFGPMLLRGEVLYWGTAGLQFVPWHQFALDTVLGGHLPLWTPGLGMGAPLLANHQSALLYPPNWALAITGVAWGHGLLVLLHLVWAGAGMITLGRRIGLSSLGQAVAAVAFSLSGYLVSRSGFLSMNAALAWTPWVLWASDAVGPDAAGRRPGLMLRSAVILAALVGLQWLAGHAQTTAYTVVMAAIWALWRGIARGGPQGGRRALGAFTAAFALGCLLAAVQLVPTIEYWMESPRAGGIPAEAALTYSFWPWRALGFLAPNLFGNPARGDFWGYGNFWEDAVYIGILPFLLALSSIWSAEARRHRGLVRLLWGFALAGLLLALGRNTPIYTLLYERVILFQAFQAPARWNLLTILALALLAGIGADGWRAPQGRALYWTRLGTAGAAAILVVSVLAAGRFTFREATIARAMIGLGLWSIAAGGLSLLKNRLQAGTWATMVLCVVVADLIGAGTGLNPIRRAGFFDLKAASYPWMEFTHRVYMPSEIERTVKFDFTHRFDTFDPPMPQDLALESGLPNLTLLAGVASANNFDPFVPARFAAWLEAIEGLPDAQLDLALALADVQGVAELNSDGSPGVTYRTLPASGRLRLVGAALPAANPEEALRFSLGRDALAGGLVIVEAPRTVADMQGPSPGEVVVQSDGNPNRVRASTDDPDGGWLVISDVWYPGWTALVDGRPAKLYPANFVFRAVWVPGGEHRIELAYRPISLPAGGLGSLAGLGIAVLGFRRRGGR